jgi:peroxiredoxin
MTQEYASRRKGVPTSDTGICDWEGGGPQPMTQEYASRGEVVPTSDTGICGQGGREYQPLTHEYATGGGGPTCGTGI